MSIEVPASQAGVLAEISVKEGETVEVGALLGIIGESANGSTPSASKAPPAPAPAAASPGNMVEISVPSGGESVTEAEVGEWFKQVGDSVAVDEAIVELETDKAAQEVMSPVSGVLKEIVSATGDTVAVGAILARIEEGASSAPSDSAAATSTGISPSETNDATCPLCRQDDNGERD